MAAADGRPESAAAPIDDTDYADAEYERLTEKFPEFRGDDA